MVDGTQCMDLAAHTEIVTAAVFGPKDMIILTASKDTSAIIWNFTTGAQLLTLSGHKLAINCAIMSEDGNLCYTGSSDMTCRVWNTSSGICLGLFKGLRKITSLWVDD